MSVFGEEIQQLDQEIIDKMLILSYIFSYIRQN